MEINTTVTILSTLSSLLGLTYLAFWAFKQFRIDEFRQNVFRLRDELFDYARAGNIAFDHPAYTMLRSLMNGYIRFSDRISLVHFIWLALLTRFTNRNFSNRFGVEWNKAIASLDEETKAKLEQFQERASMELFHYLFISSYIKKAIVLIMAIIPLLLTALLKGKVVVAFLKRKLDKSHQDLDALAYNYTKEHSAPVRESIAMLNTSAIAYGKA